MKYRRSLACAQEQICTLGAWAATLMFYSSELAEAQSGNFVWRKDADGSRPAGGKHY